MIFVQSILNLIVNESLKSISVSNLFFLYSSSFFENATQMPNFEIIINRSTY
jgi:hypothetical protein